MSIGKRRIGVMELMGALPGFRFSPTEFELVGTYLRRMVQEQTLGVDMIATIDLYKHDPWDLPGIAIKFPFMGDTEWYFFVPRHHKYPNGARPNRVTKSGYWKATGTDRVVMDRSNTMAIGLRKTLVFYKGRAPKGEKTCWIMNEYRLQNEQNLQNDVTLCKIYRKGGSSGRVYTGATSSNNNNNNNNNSRSSSVVPEEISAEDENENIDANPVASSDAAKSPFDDSDASDGKSLNADEIVAEEHTSCRSSIVQNATSFTDCGRLAASGNSRGSDQQDSNSAPQVENVMFTGFGDPIQLHENVEMLDSAAEGWGYEDFQWSDICRSLN